MKKFSYWMLAAILICGTTTLGFSLISCSNAHTEEEDNNPSQQVQSTELIRTSKSWDGVELPDYLQGRPELVAVKYEFPAGIPSRDVCSWLGPAPACLGSRPQPQLRASSP